MPRPGPRMPLVALRLDQPSVDEIDEYAAGLGLNRSEMIRLMLDEMSAVYRQIGVGRAVVGELTDTGMIFRSAAGSLDRERLVRTERAPAAG